ncbi:MAG: hypothetical protein IH991_15975 [Planctomycetes bacterium]|nr:hypothetical protein [Planctomycetota bacterium]
MKLNIHKTADETCYVARISGLSRQHRFKRDFLTNEPHQLPATKSQPARTRFCYDLADGLYEIREANERIYLAVVNNRRITVELEDLEIIEQVCKSTGFELENVFDRWAASQKRTSASLAAIARELTAEDRKVRWELPCAVCNEPVKMNKKRYSELQGAGALPLCVKNGCRGLCGPDVRDLARTHKIHRTRGSDNSVLCCPKDKDLPLNRWKLRRVWIPDDFEWAQYEHRRL